MGIALTGASSRIGAGAAVELIRRGDSAVAIDRNPLVPVSGRRVDA